MSRYHLHARIYEGSLDKVLRDERQNSEADDLADAERSAKALAACGFTVWIYDHGNPMVSSGGSNYRTIFRYDPDGQLVGYQ